MQAHDPLVGWFQLVLRHRRAVVVATALVTVLALGVLTRVTVGNTLQGIFFGDSPDYLRYVERSREFGSDEHVLVGLPAPDPTDPARIESLRRLDSFAREHPGFTRADSLATAQRIESEDGALVVVPAAEHAPEPDGTLVGRDGQSLAVVVELAVDPDRTAPEGLAHLRALMEQLAAEGIDEVHTAGFPVVLLSMLDLAWDNLYLLLPLSAAALLVVVLAVFKRLLPAVVSLGIAGLAMVWTMAVAALVDPVFSIMITAVPLVVVVVGFSDVIHLWSAWEQERALGKTREQAILASASDVGRACLLTSLTTFVGFIGLRFVPTPMFRQLGLALGVGVGLALLLAMTLVPVLLSYGLDDQAGQPRQSGRLGAAMDRFLDGILDGMRGLSTRRPRAVVAVFALCSVAALAAASQARFDADLASRVDESHPLQQDARWLAERFVGDNIVQVFIEGDEVGSVVEAEALASVARFQAAVEARPDTDQATSLVDAVERIHAVLDPDASAPLPTTSEAIAQELLLFELSGGEDLDRLVDFDRRRLRMLVQLPAAGMRATRDTALGIEALAAAHLAPGLRAEATGLSPLMGAWIDRIILGQSRGVGFSVVVVALIMALGLRSLRLGLVSMVPNLLPLLGLLGVLGLAWETTDTDTATVAMLAIGIGVDDTIHFLMRYRVEQGRTASRQQALDRTFAFAGRAILMTTVVLVVGFLPCLLSDYFSLWILGGLLPLVLVLAVLADLLLVPAMVQLGWLAVPSRGPVPPELP